jgi:hypothetical protein
MTPAERQARRRARLRAERPPPQPVNLFEVMVSHARKALASDDPTVLREGLELVAMVLEDLAAADTTMRRSSR